MASDNSGEGPFTTKSGQAGGLGSDLTDPIGTGAIDVLKQQPVEPPTKKPRKKQGGSQFQHDYGTAKVKAYPITGSELWELGGISAFASIAFSVAFACFSFIVDTRRDVDLAAGADPVITTYWASLSGTATWIGGVSLFLAIGTLALGGIKIRGIITRTHFESE